MNCYKQKHFTEWRLRPGYPTDTHTTISYIWCDIIVAATSRGGLASWYAIKQHRQTITNSTWWQRILSLQTGERFTKQLKPSTVVQYKMVCKTAICKWATRLHTFRQNQQRVNGVQHNFYTLLHPHRIITHAKTCKYTRNPDHNENIGLNGV